MAAKDGRQISIRNDPIQPYTIPSTEQMAAILDALDQAMAEGKKILLHDLRGNERAGLVLACYLIRHGQPPEALALAQSGISNSFI
jgi:protein-tyrosine phosphatase